jgi:hypothetical protein
MLCIALLSCEMIYTGSRSEGNSTLEDEQHSGSRADSASVGTAAEHSQS